MTGRGLLNVVRIIQSHILKYSSVATKQTPAEYCHELVRKYDHENYICTLPLSSKTRSIGFSIRAFNVEVALVLEQVYDSKIGQMKLKFWTDALNNTYNGNPPRIPVMLELDRVLKEKCSLSKRYFKRLIDVRSEYLNNCLLLNMNAIEKYAEYSTSSIYYLLLEGHGITDVNADHAASHLGKAQGIINLIRSVPRNANIRVNMLPQDILMKHGVSTEAIFQGQTNQGLQDAIYDIASYGKQHLDMAISLTHKLEKDIRVIFLPILCLENYLDALRKADFNIFDTKLQRSKSTLPFRILWKTFF
ncbi:NADH dehydrogenase (ubiquinone) complex I, assembly factor 6 homolog sicily [Nomia melanderi]|uniref:NADH dehydrogenase (ubiquinone) complex I, assembly factor 6 homolog sicily n=1 Tax=Nomia melanderi TaxID=2448451 RepID=UPI001303FEAB|nr:NADH dehydrogenase (ubiquinone) complex I, assembly factor 6 [Nomia melanderi]